MRRVFRLLPALALCLLVLPGRATALPLTIKTVQLSSVEAGVSNVRYDVSFSTASSGPLGSLRLQVCTNYQFDPADACDAPAGFDASVASLSSQSGITDFAISQRSANNLLLSRPLVSSVSARPLAFALSGIHNPSDLGSAYIWIQTYDDTAGAGNAADDGQIVFAINKSITINTEVPPYLLFCSAVTIPALDCNDADGSFISFGELSSKTSRTATSQLLAGTNADSGYSISMTGSTMSAGTSVIPALTTQTTSQAGTAQFGLNLRANTAPAGGSDPTGPGVAVPASGYNTPNRYRFISGDVVATTPTADDMRKLTLSYLVNVRPDQPAGNYVATVTYTCLANF